MKTKHRISGIHNDTQFFIKHSDLLDESMSLNEHEDVVFDEELICKKFKKIAHGAEDLTNDDIMREVWSAFLASSYYEPSIYDEVIALDCGLIPFYYNDMNLIALPNYLVIANYQKLKEVELISRLEAYQFLVDGSIDKDSDLAKNKNEFLENLRMYNGVNKQTIEEIINKLKGCELIK